MNVSARRFRGQHLKAFEAAGLVVVRAEGTRRIYEVDTRGIDILRNRAMDFWDEALGAFTQCGDSLSRLCPYRWDDAF